MAITESLTRFAATLIDTVHTRLELASVEIEVELARYSRYLIWSLVALFCSFVAILLAILFIVIVSWDTHRELVLAGLIGFFACAATGIFFTIHRSLAKKPPLLHSTLSEFKSDIVYLRDKAT